MPAKLHSLIFFRTNANMFGAADNMSLYATIEKYVKAWFAQEKMSKQEGVEPPLNGMKLDRECTVEHYVKSWSIPEGSEGEVKPVIPPPKGMKLDWECIEDWHDNEYTCDPEFWLCDPSVYLYLLTIPKGTVGGIFIVTVDCETQKEDDFKIICMLLDTDELKP
jgi:hypothetical protein